MIYIFLKPNSLICNRGQIVLYMICNFTNFAWANRFRYHLAFVTSGNGNFRLRFSVMDSDTVSPKALWLLYIILCIYFQYYNCFILVVIQSYQLPYLYLFACINLMIYITNKSQLFQKYYNSSYFFREIIENAQFLKLNVSYI